MLSKNIAPNSLSTDEKDRERALDPRQSFIVQAPAGSGKTELLIQRFLTLLNYVNNPEEILAITFTKKAANEMRTRVILALKNAAQGITPTNPNVAKTQLIALQVLQRDQQFGWQLLLNPNRLHIQTIDALCVYLTKSLPLLSRFGAQPNLTDFPLKHYREASQSVLLQLEDEHLPWSTAIAQLLLHVDNDMNKLNDLLVELLAKRDQWMQYIHLDIESLAIKKQLEHHLALVISERLTNLKQAFPPSEIAEFLAILRFASAQPAEKLTYCQDMQSLPGTQTNDLKAWQTIADFLLTKQLKWRKRVDKEIGFPPLTTLSSSHEKTLHKKYRERYLAMLSRFQAEDWIPRTSRGTTAFFALLKEILSLPQPTYADKQWQILCALFQVLKVVAAQLRLIFQQSGQIDFIENAQAALLALGSEDKPTDLLLSLDYAIQHILIDEFQDTSSTQFNLLEKLISGWEPDDGRTLFVVGDPMQSIYRFREAEVGLFLRMRTQGIGGLDLIPLTLTANFRSAPHIVEWNNKHFKTIFPDHNDIATGAVSYCESVAKNRPNSSDVHLHGFVTDNDQLQADSIVKVILEVQKQNPHETIAILVRSRTHLKTIIPTLKKANISFYARDIDGLATRQPIQDLLALTIGLIHLADRIAWLSLLRAPWCGLSLNDLFILAGEDRFAILWDQLQNPAIIARLSSEGQKRIKRIMPILMTQLDNRNRSDIRTWIETTWQLLGGPATLNHLSEIQDANAYFELLTAHQYDHLYLHIDMLKEQVASCYAANDVEDESQLQIMTIHSAKGLEFDTVIIPHLEKKLPRDDKTLLTWMERPLSNDKTALLLAPLHASDSENDRLYEYIHRQKIIKSDYETDRLFYVATTRAKNSLHLFYNVEFDADKKPKIASNSFLEKIWPAIVSEQQGLIIDHNPHQDEHTSAIENPRLIKRLHTDWKNIVDIPQQKIFFHRQQSGFLLTDQAPKLIGIVIHRIMQNLAQHGIGWWQRKTSKQCQIYLQQILRQQGVPQTDLACSVSTVSAAVTNCIKDKRGQWILHAHQHAFSEYPISVMLDNEIKKFVIDRTFIDEQDTRWIIDFKTTMFKTDDLTNFLATEYEKYKEKMAWYHRAFQLIEKRPTQLGLYFPAIPAWKAWELES